MRTLEETIAYEREKAKEQRSRIGTWNEEYSKRCEEHAEEHEQLAEWLEELKANKVTSEEVYEQGYNRGYSKAIDDLIAECENAKFAESDEISLSDVHTGVNSGLSMAIHFAEQLKAGETE